MEYSLIANSGIQVLTFRVSINLQDHFKQWFHEWYDKDSGEWKLELVYEVTSDEIRYYYKKAELLKGGYLASEDIVLNPDELREDGILPLRIDDDLCVGVSGKIYKLTFSDKDNKLPSFENRWLPIPYFSKSTRKRFNFGPFNWSRFKLVPIKKENGQKIYDVVLAFDTHASYETDEHKEYPVFSENFRNEIEFELCSNELFLLDYCSTGKTWSYVDRRLLHLAHPDITNVAKLKGENVKRLSYAASYIFLIQYLCRNELFPAVKLYSDRDADCRDIDMVIDIGNSKTTALLIEDNENFNQVRSLSLVDFTNILCDTDKGSRIRKYDEPFDMRLAFRKANFGNFEIANSRQFVYPSLVRLGQEANNLIHAVSNIDSSIDELSTYSSPKRYLWDGKPNKEEWRFLVLPKENQDTILQLNSITSQFKSDGQLATNGEGGITFHYSRRSLMTLAFLEMLAQAHSQVNSISHRSSEEGFGHPEQPRRVKRVIVTCPTAMSKLEREALVRCAKDAISILSRFNGSTENPQPEVEVIPSVKSLKDTEEEWYYDEATCSQLVYMYGEVAHKYKGCCGEFFNLYGKVEEGETQPSLTIGSLDIGAGTSDLMISRYTYEKDTVTTITPEPLFYDSFYFAGDDMLKGLVRNVMLLNNESAFRQHFKDLPTDVYRQKIKDLFGPDHNGQTAADRQLRKDFNIQYSVPLMCHFLELLKTDGKDCLVRYEDVFSDGGPNAAIVAGFMERTGIDITKLEWRFEMDKVMALVEKEFEPLLKQIATIMYAFACDVVLLSGRPASLPAVRNLFLKFYPVSPDRLIILNNYYVGDWYPFSNNTGCIANPKTIVAMGGVIGYYASEYSNLNGFHINLDKLKSGLKSTVNFIESSREGQPIEYFITPDKPQGDITLTKIPSHLTVRQIGLDTYPPRALYTIDFDRHRMGDKARKKALLNGGKPLDDTEVRRLVREQIDRLKKLMPFTLTLARDPEDKESLSILSILDRNNNEVAEGNLEIHLQSLGADDKYWLDSGAFNF